MPHSHKSSPQPGNKAVLLAIKPKYADLILVGSKRVEFRRVWAARDVHRIALYSSAPVRKIVGLAEIENVLIASPSSLWKTCVEKSGGLTRRELRAYFAGKTKGFAVLLKGVTPAPEYVNPSEIINDFKPPQSFRYLKADEYAKLERTLMACEKGRGEYPPVPGHRYWGVK